MHIKRWERTRNFGPTRFAFSFIFLLTVAYLIIGQVVLPDEGFHVSEEVYSLDGTWKLIRENGTTEDIEIPGTYPVERGEWITVETTLPATLEDNFYIVVRCPKQNVFFYVDGELRKELNLEESRLFGKYDPVVWVFIPVDAKDAGCTFSVKSMTESLYHGTFYSVLYGERFDIWGLFFHKYGPELLVALFIAVFGLLTVIVSLILAHYYKRTVELEFLGSGVLLASAWLIFNSLLRQAIFSNISAISDMTYLMVACLPIPFCLYMDSIQKFRYHVAYVVMEYISIAVFITTTVLHATKIVDFSDSMVAIAVALFLAIAVIAITIIIDIFKKWIHEYLLIAIGLAGAFVCAILQVTLYYGKNQDFNGSAIALGLAFLLLVAILNTCISVLRMEREKQMADMDNKAKNIFLANISHEIRTPMHSILGLNDMVLRESDDEIIREYATKVRHAGNNLLGIINDVLDASQISSGKFTLEEQDYSLSEFVDQITDTMEVHANDKGLDFRVFVDSDIPCRLHGDVHHFGQILNNLLSNAIKYTSQGSVELSIQGVKDGENEILHVVVKDTGIGMDQSLQEHLYKQFGCLNSERNLLTEGKGLGLSITNYLLTMMGGGLKMTSTPGKGSTFFFNLSQKIVDAAPVGDSMTRKKQRKIEKYEASFEAPEAKLLIVDDTEINLYVIRNLLKDTGVQITTAGSGMECLKLCKEQRYDLILMDHMMPEMDGIETLRGIRGGDNLCKNTPVIAMTANVVDHPYERYMELGFDGFLPKPIGQQLLEDTIHEFLTGCVVAERKKDADYAAVPEQDTVPETTTENEKMNTIENPEGDNNMELPMIDGIDWDYGRLHFGGMDDLLKETAEQYYMMLKESVDKIRIFYESVMTPEGLNNYRIETHSVKSTSALIGALQLHGLAKTAEFAAKDEDYNTIHAITPILLREMEKMHAAMQPFFAKENAANKELDVNEVRMLSEKIRQALSVMDIDAVDDAVAKLSEFKFDQSLNDVVQQIQTATMNLDISRTNDLLDSLMAGLEG